MFHCLAHVQDKKSKTTPSSTDDDKDAAKKAAAAAAASGSKRGEYKCGKCGFFPKKEKVCFMTFSLFFFRCAFKGDVSGIIVLVVAFYNMH